MALPPPDGPLPKLIMFPPLAFPLSNIPEPPLLLPPLLRVILPSPLLIAFIDPIVAPAPLLPSPKFILPKGSSLFLTVVFMAPTPAPAPNRIGDFFAVLEELASLESKKSLPQPAVADDEAVVCFDVIAVFIGASNFFGSDFFEAEESKSLKKEFMSVAESFVAPKVAEAAAVVVVPVVAEEVMAVVDLELALVVDVVELEDIMPDMPPKPELAVLVVGRLVPMSGLAIVLEVVFDDD
mmetsp:Transcript_25113/g.28699  ORF Transcript_25113/g.28699 Transcript_25113/m.28699 type:complete len:238 (+) Transcript_25113:596-1309(+)